MVYFTRCRLWRIFRVGKRRETCSFTASITEICREIYQRRKGIILITKVVEKLKTGSIQNVVPFGEGNLPEPPYIVVKPETDPVGRGRSYRIIAHFLPGQQTYMEDYIYNELSDLLTDYSDNSRHGNRNTLYMEQDITDYQVSNDDGTVSMERVFLMPSRLF